VTIAISAAHALGAQGRRVRMLARHHPAVAAGTAILVIVLLATVAAPWLAGHDPLFVDPLARLRPPSAQHWLGTDALGRDVWSRTVHGGRVSLVVGVAAAVIATGAGLLIGLVSGYSRIADAVLMRVMDGLMSIPSILLAIALMAVVKASLATVVVAIAVVAGSSFGAILRRHILPNTLAPVIVQATYIGAAAILIESLLSFLGAGTPPEVASWGNIMAEGRLYFLVAPWIIFAPGMVLAMTVLAINLVGDGVRDMLDPRFAKRI
jgi:peptide/nickel transport system permease protein